MCNSCLPLTDGIPTEQASTQCPDTKLVLSGYSQGGQLVHNAAAMLSADVTDFVAAGTSRHTRPCAPLKTNTSSLTVLIFGDPYNGEAVGNIPASKVQVYCHPLDGICAGLGLLTPSHGTYDQNALEAAEWVASTVGY